MYLVVNENLEYGQVGNKNLVAREQATSFDDEDTASGFAIELMNNFQVAFAVVNSLQDDEIVTIIDSFPYSSFGFA